MPDSLNAAASAVSYVQPSNLESLTRCVFWDSESYRFTEGLLRVLTLAPCLREVVLQQKHPSWQPAGVSKLSVPISRDGVQALQDLHERLT